MCRQYSSDVRFAQKAGRLQPSVLCENAPPMLDCRRSTLLIFCEVYRVVFFLVSMRPRLSRSPQRLRRDLSLPRMRRPAGGRPRCRGAGGCAVRPRLARVVRSGVRDQGAGVGGQEADQQANIGRRSSVVGRPSSGVWAKHEWVLPQLRAENIVTLGEGFTPLIPSPRLAKSLGSTTCGSSSAASATPVRSRTWG